MRFGHSSSHMVVLCVFNGDLNRKIVLKLVNLALEVLIKPSLNYK